VAETDDQVHLDGEAKIETSADNLQSDLQVEAVAQDMVIEVGKQETLPEIIVPVQSEEPLQNYQQQVDQIVVEESPEGNEVVGQSDILLTSNATEEQVIINPENLSLPQQEEPAAEQLVSSEDAAPAERSLDEE
jgi:hypothetical protein